MPQETSAHLADEDKHLPLDGVRAGICAVVDDEQRRFVVTAELAQLCLLPRPRERVLGPKLRM